jgi:hypothetical protein
MPRSTRTARTLARSEGAPFVLYVEGPRDRDLLRIWCQRHQPASVRAVRSAVILGGRQPNRAVAHFRSVRAAEPGARGLCILDRDDPFGPGPAPEEPGLAIFTWGRRHIESYLLVPEALRRVARDQKERFRLERFAREHLPRAADESAWGQLDAKRLLERDGPLARGLGRPIPAAAIARTIRMDELHADVLSLLDHMRTIPVEEDVEGDGSNR